MGRKRNIIFFLRNWKSDFDHEEEFRETRFAPGEKIDKVMIKVEDHEERIVTLEGSVSV